MTMSAEEQARMEAALEALRRGYLERLPIELEVLRGLAAHLLEEDAGRAQLDELHLRLHRLAGSGGTFGLSQLSAQARVLEEQVKNWRNSTRRVDLAERASMAAAVAALGAELKEAESGAQSELDVVLAGEGELSAGNEAESKLIWLVEDDLQLGLELVLLLGQFGFNVRHFTRLEELEESTRLRVPDALIMDVSFPDEGRFTTDDEGINQLVRTLTCPLLFISSQSDFATRLAVARLGAAGFLSKPIDVPRLVDRLETIFEQQSKLEYRVLVVDDDVPLGEYYRLVLSAAGMAVRLVSEPEKVLDEISQFHPDLVVMDMHMPGCSGPELAAVIRQFDEWIGLPIIFLSSEVDLEEQLNALERGADEFLTKPISERHLVMAVRARGARARQLADLMSKDSLTGLFKHAYFKEALRYEYARAQRHGKPISVVMIDIDHFKRVNDTYGHAVGDRVIRALAHLFKQRLRSSDIIGRYGGEEFAIVLPECESARAQEIMDDIRARFAALHFHHAGVTFSVTLSAGIVCSSQHRKLDSDELLVVADGALYTAKYGGRNRVCVAE